MVCPSPAASHGVTSAFKLHAHILSTDNQNMRAGSLIRDEYYLVWWLHGDKRGQRSHDC